MQPDNLIIEEIGTESHVSPEAAQEASQGGDANMSCLADALCRLVAGILTRELGGESAESLTGPVGSLQFVEEEFV